MQEVSWYGWQKKIAIDIWGDDTLISPRVVQDSESHGLFLPQLIQLISPFWKHYS